MQRLQEGGTQGKLISMKRIIIYRIILQNIADLAIRQSNEDRCKLFFAKDYVVTKGKKPGCALKFYKGDEYDMVALLC